MFRYDSVTPLVPTGFCPTCKSPVKYRRCVACAEEDREQVFWSPYFQIYRHKVTGELEIYRFHDGYLDISTLNCWNDCEYFAKAIGVWDEIKDFYNRDVPVLDMGASIESAVDQAKPFLLNKIYNDFGPPATISALDLEKLFEGS